MLACTLDQSEKRISSSPKKNPPHPFVFLTLPKNPPQNTSWWTRINQNDRSRGGKERGGGRARHVRGNSVPIFAQINRIVARPGQRVASGEEENLGRTKAPSQSDAGIIRAGWGVGDTRIYSYSGVSFSRGIMCTHLQGGEVGL